MTARKLLSESLKHVESESIRAWATSDANKAIWLKIAAESLKKNPKTDPVRFATYIVCTAMG